MNFQVSLTTSFNPAFNTDFKTQRSAMEALVPRAAQSSTELHAGSLILLVTLCSTTYCPKLEHSSITALQHLWARQFCKLQQTVHTVSLFDRESFSDAVVIQLGCMVYPNHARAGRCQLS